MKTVFQIFSKSIVAEYYRRNMVFIFVIVLFCFGFLRAPEHIAIARQVLRSPLLLGLTFLVWGLNWLKTMIFVLRLMKERAYGFLYQARLLPVVHRFAAFSAVVFNLSWLTFLYAVFMAVIGMEEQLPAAAALLVIFHFLLALSGAFLMEYRIRRPGTTGKKSALRPFLPSFSTPGFLFFIRYLMAKQPVLLLITKSFTLAMLAGCCLLYPTDDYDERLLAIGALLAGAAQVVISGQFFVFENRHLLLLKNLPLTSAARLAGYFKTHAVLLLPEMIILLNNLPEGVAYGFAVQLWWLVLGICLLIHFLGFIPGVPEDTLMKGLFYGGVVVFLLIMFRVPVLLLTGAALLSSVLVFRKYYYLAEYHEE